MEESLLGILREDARRAFENGKTLEEAIDQVPFEHKKAFGHFYKRYVEGLKEEEEERKRLQLLASEGRKKCPYCAEEILLEAIKCKHCKTLLSEDTLGKSTNLPTSASNKSVKSLHGGGKDSPLRTTKTKRVLVRPGKEQADKAKGCYTIIVALVAIALCITVIGIPLGWYMLWRLSKERASFHDPSAVRRGECPYCSLQIDIKEGILGANCPACNNRVIVQGDSFLAIS